MWTYGCLGKYAKRLAGRTDIEDALDRLDRLMQEESLVAVAQGLKATGDVDNKVEAIDDKIQHVDSKVERVDDAVQGIDDKVQNIDNKVQRVGNKVQDVDDSMRDIHDKIDVVVDGT
jgi:peptidoglycan hydrolase CwlO-like protein